MALKQALGSKESLIGREKDKEKDEEKAGDEWKGDRDKQREEENGNNDKVEKTEKEINKERE